MLKTDAVKKQVADVVKTASDLDDDGIHEIERELRHLLADTFALYIKT